MCGLHSQHFQEAGLCAGSLGVHRGCPQGHLLAAPGEWRLRPRRPGRQEGLESPCTRTRHWWVHTAQGTERTATPGAAPMRPPQEHGTRSHPHSGSWNPGTAPPSLSTRPGNWGAWGLWDCQGRVRHTDASQALPQARRWARSQDHEGAGEEGAPVMPRPAVRSSGDHRQAGSPSSEGKRWPRKVTFPVTSR